VPELGQEGCAYANLNDLDSLEIHSPELDYFTDFDPWMIETCKDCSLLPICAGDCPRRHKYEEIPPCTTKVKLAERLAFWEEYSRENPHIRL
jgi:radical SAM protein with 4Fe4S-binding SPASM domain